MCKVEEIMGKNFDIDQILEEYYDPEIAPLTEEEWEKIFEKYGENTEKKCVGGDNQGVL